MENFITAALLLPRSTAATTGSPTVLGKAPEGFAALLQGLGQENLEFTPKVPADVALEENTRKTPDEPGKDAVATSPEAVASLIPVQVVAGAPTLLQSQPPATPTGGSAEAAPEQGGSSIPLPVLKAPFDAQQLVLQEGLLPGERRSVSGPALDHPRGAPGAMHHAAPTGGKGIDLALLEEAGMNILRATGEAEIRPPTLRPTAAPTARQSVEEAPSERQVTQQARTAPQDVLVKSPEVAAPLVRAVLTSRTMARAEDRSAPTVSSNTSVTSPSEASGDPTRLVEVARENTRTSLLETATADRTQPATKPMPSVEKPAAQARAEHGPQERPVAPESPEAPVAQHARSLDRGGADQVIVRADQIPSSRAAIKEGAGQVATARAPEIARTLVDQVIRAFQLEVKGPVSEMRLKLEPESLGELVLRVRVEDGKMQARIEVSQPAVKAVIEGNLPQLRQALTTQGIQMERIDITTQDRSLARGNSEGSGGRERRRSQKEGDAVLEETPVHSVRMLGYNTIELTM